MECNKDEALRAKESAETKIIQKDFMGAQKFTIKAHNLFPSLEGLSQLVATLDLYLRAEKLINGEVDLYRVFDVDPLADDETIRKNYRKLALILHPDKNKSAGAEGAFKIVSEAWSLLQDKDKRASYDQRRNLRGTNEKVMMQKASMPAGKNGFQQKTSNNHPSPQVYPPCPSRPDTFWTSCGRCFMHYEYLRSYLHQKLLCPNCRQPFLAIEITNLSGNRHAANNLTRAVGGGVGQPSSVTVQKSQPPKSGTSGCSSVKLKRGREAETGAGGEGALQTKLKVDGGLTKKKRVDESKLNNNNKHSTHHVPSEREGSLYANGKGGSVGGGERVVFPPRNKPNSTRELSHSETRNMLMAKARIEINKKLNEWDLASKEEIMRAQKEKDNVDSKKADVDGVRKEREASRPPPNITNQVQPKHSPKPSDVNLDVEPPVIMSMPVPDPDFHDFDKDRTEKSFGENEVWAAYDDDDGMPRFYALIHHVISKRPFRLKMSWLNSKTNSELGPMNWVGSGFRKTSGNFYIGKHEVNRTLNAFSHKVKFTRGKGVIQIFPAKGDVWALYKNWSRDWSVHTAEQLIHSYEMVIVLDDYTEDQGIAVLPLAKVPGFKSVFHQEFVPREARKIPREEIFRFSHQVPCYQLTGQEGKNVPKGCLELDPAALPSELLKVITEDQSVKNVEDVKEELPGISKKDEGKRVITYSRRRVGMCTKEGKGKEVAGTANVAVEKHVVSSG